MIGILRRLRRRKLVQWGLAYAAGAWVLLQVLGLMAESFEWPRLVMQIGFGVALLGFGVAIVLAWYHGERGEQHITGPELVIISVLLGVGGAVLWRGVGHAPAARAPTAAAVAPRPSAVRPPEAPPKSIAVLPFDNLSGDPKDAYLADGLQEEILNALARLRDMKVISRTSVMDYRGHDQNVREIGQRLGVRTILEGSVRRQGDTLRLTIQLIDARNDNHLLATNYDRKLDNVLGLQTTVARLVADALSATLSSYERGNLDRVATNSGDAYDRYLHAVALFRQPVPGDDSGVIEPRRLLQEALKFDPDYADAWALLSQTNTWIYYRNQDPATGRAARAAFEKALALDPDLPEAKLARGIYATYVIKDLDQAILDLGSVVAVRPNSAEAQQVLGFALRRRGAMADALEHLHRAWDLDPLNPVHSAGPITTLLGLRRYPEAIEETNLDTARFPNDVESYFVRARIQVRMQNSLDPLRAALRDHGNQLDPPDRKAVEAEIAEDEGRYLDAVRLWNGAPAFDPLSRGTRIGLLYLAAGDPVRARQEFLRAERSVANRSKTSDLSSELMNLAIVQSLLDKHSEALRTIEQARDQSPEKGDASNGPLISFVRSLILVRAGRREEGYAEAVRLLHVPFGSPTADFFGPDDAFQLVPEAKDPRFDALINHPPRL